MAIRPEGKKEYLRPPVVGCVTGLELFEVGMLCIEYDDPALGIIALPAHEGAKAIV